MISSGCISPFLRVSMRQGSKLAYTVETATLWQAHTASTESRFKCHLVGHPYPPSTAIGKLEKKNQSEWLLKKLPGDFDSLLTCPPN